MLSLQGQPILIYDIESSTERKKAKAETDIIKLFGCYSFLTNKYYYLTQPSLIRQMIAQHNVLVGFNNKEYDNQVMYRNKYDDLIQYKPNKKKKGGLYTFRNKVNIDMRELIKKRVSAMVIKLDGKKVVLKDALMDFSLDTITRTLRLVNDDTAKIKDFDYKIFNKSEWSAEEQKDIVEYVSRDLELTKKLYEWLEDYFESFQQFVPKKDVDTKQYLTCSLASFAYKVVCNKLQMKEEYNDLEREDKFKGAVVFNPMAKEIHGKIVYFDFKSLYPSMYIQANLFGANCGCCSKEEKWNGGELLKVNGRYCTKTLDRRTELVKEWFKYRDELKKQKNPLENIYKILINSIYGASSSPIFKHIYDETAASDCTYLGRQCIQYARKKFREGGCRIVFGDTDSCAVLVPEGKDIDYAINISKQITNDLREAFPHPFEMFDFKVECIATDFFFFDKSKTDPEDTEYIDEEDAEYAKLKLGKKNYIYITDKGELTTKGLLVIKKNCSTLSRKIYDEILRDKILKERVAKFPKKFMEDLIYGYLDKDIGFAAKRFSTNDFEDYKEAGNLNAQISKHFGGAGYYWMVPVVKDIFDDNGNKISIGKGKKYIPREVFIEKKMPIRLININNFWKELSYFISPEDLKEIKVTTKRKTRNRVENFNMEKLGKWFS